jgi:hypothetical protein
MAESFVGAHRRVDQSSLRDYGPAERFLNAKSAIHRLLAAAPEQ